MSLSDELSEIVEGGNANKQNKGCYTCKWLARLSPEDLKSFNDWIESKRSLAQLWQVCTEQPDPLDVSLSGMRWHMVHHAKWL